MNSAIRTRWAAGVTGLLLTSGVVAAVIMNNGTPQQPAARARHYTARQACLLTDAKGITSTQTAAVWAGMETASLATHAKVMYLQTSGPDTPANAIPYANTLIQRHCDVILATGAAQTEALTRIARTAPAIHFVVVRPGTTSTDGNVTGLPWSAATRSQVAHSVEDALTLRTP